MNVLISSQLFVPLSATGTTTTSSSSASVALLASPSSPGKQGGGSSNNPRSAVHQTGTRKLPSAPGSGANVVRSLQGFASLVGSLIQLKAIVSTVSFEIFVKDKELMTILNGSF